MVIRDRTITGSIIQDRRDFSSNEVLSKYSCINKIIAIIPTQNDELTIGSVILKAKSFCQTIIVVDDGSIDRTVEICTAAGIEIIALHSHSGKGFAVIAGLKRAYELGCDIAILVDGDSRYKIREIPLLIEHEITSGVDLVIGSRYLSSNEDLQLKQQFKLKLLLRSQCLKDGLILTDPFSGFMAINRRILQNLNFSFAPEDFPEAFITHLLSKNITIKEFPISDREIIKPKIFWDYSYKTIVAFPAFNEEKSLPSLIEAVKQYVDLVLVVDDGSKDATAVVARNMGALVISHPENMGYGAALQTIFSSACNLNAEALVIMDSDGQHNPHDVQWVLEALLTDVDIVIGSRFLQAKSHNMPRYRKLGMKVLDKATFAAGVKNVSDTQSGFRGYGKRAIDVINISGNGMSAGSEILIQAKDNNLSIAEVPITVRYDLEDTSSQNPVYHGLSVLSNIIALISYRRPLPTFGIPGLIIFIVGVISASYAFKEYYITTRFPFTLSIMGGICLILGILLGITGLILNAFLVLMPKK